MAAKFERFLDHMKGKKVSVLGIGVSNTPLIKLLLRAEAKVTACDRREKSEFAELASEIESLGAKLKLGHGYLSGLDADIVFRTPGMRPDLPELNEARARGCVITSEMEAFFDVCPCTIIGVTGSDGKTTTSTIIAEMLRAAGRTVYLGGNIGKPLLSDADGMIESDFAVVELSSFQLMTMKKSPNVAVITNITPNHLDMHKSMDEYIQSKKNIFEYQRPGDLLVLNFDNELTWGMSGEAKGRLRMFSRKMPLPRGICLDGGVIVENGDGAPHKILNLARIALPGQHNVENYMAAIAAVRAFVDDDSIRRVAQDFGGVEHRIEFVREVRGVRFYNDSIASSPARTKAGLESFSEKVILIAGGYDKKIPFDSLGPVILDRVKHLSLVGATAGKIEEAVKASPEYVSGAVSIARHDDFETAVRNAFDVSEAGDTVILSPACASFDMFRDFAERGAKFKEIVNSL